MSRTTPSLLGPLFLALVATVHPERATGSHSGNPSTRQGESKMQKQETGPSELVELSTVELAAAIRTRRLSSREVVAAFLDRIQAVNPKWNAVVTLDAPGALRRAEEADAALAKGVVWGPLHGVPFTIKDAFGTRGMRSTAGHEPLKDHIPKEDAVVVRRLLDAGAILMGKTNTPALAMDMQTTNTLFGTTGNAHDPSWTAGGSSGGAAVAVATRLSPFEVGSDLAGSIRLPAAFNGVYGLRPTFGLVSMRGHLPPKPGDVDGIRRMAVAGPIAHELSDLAFLLDILGGPGVGDHRRVPVPPSTGAPQLADLRIAWSDGFGGVPVSQEIRQAIQAFARRIESGGARVERAEPTGFPYDLAWETWGALVGAQGGYERSNLARSIGDFFTRSARASSPMLRRIVGPITVPGYMEALTRQDTCIERLETFLADHDVWIVPVSSTTAFPHHAPTRKFGEFFVYDTPLDVDGTAVPYYVATQSYTTVFSLTESPVVTIPIEVDHRGAPIGVQIVGRRFDDRRLIEIAKLLDDFAYRSRRGGLDRDST